MFVSRLLYKSSLIFRGLLLVIAIGFAVSPLFAQNTETEKPLSLKEILTSLRLSKTGLPTTNRILIQKIKTSGVDFIYNSEAAKNLTAAGGNADLISEIKFANVGMYYDEALKCGKQDYDCQLKNYGKAVELMPDNAVSYYNRAIVYDEKGDYELAVKDYTKAITLDPKYINAYYNRGITTLFLNARRLIE
jgi:tetratricopeptide (TPR) repeat protein